MSDKEQATRWADAPERIWLQVCDDAGCVESFAEHDGVTWCQHRINDTDIEYVRDDRIAALEAALEQARVALALLVTKADESDDIRYGTLGTTFVRVIAGDALRAIEEVRRG